MATADENVRIQQLFGERLRLLRSESGMSQEELAAHAGLDRTYISSTERGKRNISLLAMSCIASALKTTPAAFFQIKEDAR